MYNTIIADCKREDVKGYYTLTKCRENFHRQESDANSGDNSYGIPAFFLTQVQQTHGNL